uniref:Uncharacterized protein n=1 Tax=Anguilla anguilla TaxID=7936 RepID=A0A0E9WHF0_ANGAN
MCVCAVSQFKQTCKMSCKALSLSNAKTRQIHPVLTGVFFNENYMCLS